MDNETKTNAENIVPEKEEKSTDMQEFESLLKARLQERYDKGVRVGMMTVSKIVMDLLNDKQKSFTGRIESVKHFCKITTQLDQRQKILDNTKNDPECDDGVSE